MKEKIYHYLRTIPKGKVTTYKMIAEYLGNKNLARYVGTVLHQNKNENLYPCYKVVNSRGKLASSFAFGGLEGQKKRLENDGIKVIDYRVDLNEYLQK